MARTPGSREDRPHDPDAPLQAPTEEQIELAQREAGKTVGARTGTVTVGCKVPNGVILQLCIDEETSEPVMGGGHRGVKVSRKVGERYVIAGPSLPFATLPQFVTAGGYRLTSGVPIDFWEKWVEQNRDSEIVRRELIIAYPSMDKLKDHCEANKDLLTGLEPINPQRLPKGIMTAPEQGNRTAQ